MTKSVLALTLLLLYVTELSAKCRAVLISGGGTPELNYSIHAVQLREMYNSLRARGCEEKDIAVFSASGNPQSTDFRADPTHPLSDYVANPYKFNGKDRVPKLYAADKETLEKEVPKFLKESSPQDKVFVYISNHGGKRKDGTIGFIPWDPEGKRPLVTVPEFDSWLSQAPQGSKIKVWTECCFCGEFNKIKRPNTCAASSTDSYHEASYDWVNWDKYTKSPDTAKKELTVKSYFAGELKNKPDTSLSSASAVAMKLTQNTDSYKAETFKYKCFVGPRTSLEQMIFDQLGFGNQKLCLDDLLKMFQSKSADKVNKICSQKTGLAEIENLKKFLESADSQNLSSADRFRIKKLQALVDKHVDSLAQNPYHKSIVELKKRYDSLNPKEKLRQATIFQAKASELREKLMTAELFETLLSEQRILIEALYLAKATSKQKEEYYRKKACLEEKLI